MNVRLARGQRYLRGEAKCAPVEGSRGRVLMVTSSFPRWPGDGTTPFVSHLAQDLLAQGWNIDVLAPHAKGAAKMETIDDLTIRRFQYLWPASAQTVCYQGGALTNLRNRRSNLAKLPALILAEWLAVTGHLASRRYDLVHSHWILPQGFTVATAAGVLRIPHIATVHGSDVFALRGSMFKVAKRVALATADAVTVNSSATEAAVRRLAPSLSNLHRIPMGVTADRPHDPQQTALIRKRLGVEVGPVLGFVGRLVREKGVDDLLRAAALISPELPDLRVLVVGEGPDRSALHDLAHSLGIAERVLFAGWISPERLPDHLAACSMFVGPSKRGADGTTEAQGLVFAEALAAGLPVIATRLGGIVDLVRDGETGLLVDEAAPEQIARAIRALARDSARAGRLAVAGRGLVMRHFTRQASAEKFSALYAACIGRKVAAAGLPTDDAQGVVTR